MNEQIISIWNSFFENKVKYITIGGFAVNIYGYNRNTGDIDIYLEDTIENRINLRKALKSINLGDFETIETMQFIPGWTDFSLSYGLRLDIMTTVKGLEDKSFASLLDDATIVMIDETPVYFIDYDNLIIAKKAANRPKDILDIEELDKINNNTKENN
ncbi:nucleotidyltransferase [Flavobacterium sp. LC2016-12]|uniref:nucleotidyltransferase n=1 Tax=Flavobacterium sp. LC2016-12 TaxID=2783794 RepID=UPI00188B44C2|nr:nucleotidyltransferase [Flavobacterium sp. LC2016-12]MBF4463762.1 nucleotidyltransferase [Flavobacterium sp. LC2016-12]